MLLTADLVKAKARELGADAVGIADAAVLNAHPPDPKFPQTPERISPEIKSVVAIVKRIPAGLCESPSVVTTLPTRSTTPVCFARSFGWICGVPAPAIDV